LSRCRTIESRAPDVIFDPSEVRQILELVLEQARQQAIAAIERWGERPAEGEIGFQTEKRRSRRSHKERRFRQELIKQIAIGRQKITDPPPFFFGKRLDGENLRPATR